MNSRDTTFEVVVRSDAPTSMLKRAVKAAIKDIDQVGEIGETGYVVEDTRVSVSGGLDSSQVESIVMRTDVLIDELVKEFGLTGARAAELVRICMGVYTGADFLGDLEEAQLLR